MRKTFLLVIASLIVAVMAMSTPVHAVVTNTTWFLKNTTEGTCSGGCKLLNNVSTGTADATTILTVAKNVNDFQAHPYATSSTTGTPSSTTPGGFGWETATALGVGFIAQTWTLHVKTTASTATGTGFLWAEIWSCSTISEGTCIIVWDERLTATNIFGTTTATVNTYTASVAAQSKVNFLVLELWVHMTVATGSNTATLAITTVASSTSDLVIPDAFANGISQSITDASALTHVTSWKDGISQSITDASALAKVAAHPRALAQSITDASGLGKVAAHLYGLAQSITDASALTHVTSWKDGLAQSISDSASMTSLVSIFFLHGHSALTCVTKPSLTCEYDVFFTPAPQSIAGALTHVTSWKDALIQSITGLASLAKSAGHLESLSQSVSAASSFARMIAVSISLAQSIAANSVIAHPANHLYSIADSVTANLAMVRQASHFAQVSASVSSSVIFSAGRFVNLAQQMGLASAIQRLVGYRVSEAQSIGAISEMGKAAGHFVSIATAVIVISTDFVSVGRIFNLAGQVGTGGQVSAVCFGACSSPPAPPLLSSGQILAVFVLAIVAIIGFAVGDRKRRKYKQAQGKGTV